MSRSDIESIGHAHASHTEVANILGSYKLYVNPDEISVAVHLSHSGYWEAWITKWFIDTVKPGFTCVDVGANFGYYTRLLEKLCGPAGKVYAVEANPALAAGIKKSVKDFPMKEGAEVIVHNVAMSDSEGTAELAIFGNNLGGASILAGGIHGVPITEYLSVKKTTLNTLVDEDEHIDLVKLDIEGAEQLALKGMESMMDRIDTVVLEILPVTPKNNPRFIHELFYKYNVTIIDYQGNEQPITFEKLLFSEDLSMLVIRK
jgi:FkbM family methyltransferase